MEIKTKKILIVDDEEDVQGLFLQRFRKELKSGELDFQFALSGKEALEYLQHQNPLEVVMLLSDINMPGMNGLELLEKTRELFPDLKVIMITAYGDEESKLRSIQLGAAHFFTKPVDFKELKECLN